MNVCGGHERTVSHSGLRKALPENVEIIPGPGCPVCICPEEDVYDAIQLALRDRLTVLAFGDMLRVPVNLPRREVRSLDQAKAAGAHVIPIATPMEAVRLAKSRPADTFVFFAAGFETTMAPVAAMLAESAPSNLRILLSGRLTWPAVSMLLEGDRPGFDALIAPGHVATVMGSREWAFVAGRHGIPAAVAGFRLDTLLAALFSVLRQLVEGEAYLDNCYAEAVSFEGNQFARQCLKRVMTVEDANWRGIGKIAMSGFALNADYRQFDVFSDFPRARDAGRKRVGEMPAGCDCARVVLGKIYPDQCRLYGRACQPRQPAGPCMVSDEGACRIWWSSGVRQNRRSAELH
jgi:hydrogenase expression/formation protein HypD